MGPKRVFNCVASKKQEDDWKMEQAIEKGYLKAHFKLPKSVDLRRDWWPVGNQGSTGSCVGWSTGHSLLRYHMVKAKKIKQDEKISVRFIWMASKEMDEWNDYPTTFIDDAGTSLKQALKTAKKVGALKASVLPFKGKMATIPEGQFLQTAAKLKIKAYFNLINSKQDKIEMFKNWLAQRGPILTCLDVDESWDKLMRKNFDTMEKYVKNKDGRGHAVSIVGYTPTHFIIRNSWGPKWGNNGFGFASYEYVNDAFKEAYGIVV